MLRMMPPYTRGKMVRFTSVASRVRILCFSCEPFMYTFHLIHKLVKEYMTIIPACQTKNIQEIP